MQLTRKKTPIEAYELDLKQDNFNVDPVQRMAVEHTQRLYEELIVTQNQSLSETKKINFFQSWRRKSEGNKNKLVKGLYLWGGVGRGKTYIVDNFFNCLPFENKRRMHFHSFMQWIHGELKLLRDVQEPLSFVADNFAKQSRIICLDEFHVSDITDAMLLGKILGALFERGVTLVATSNEEPEQLYSGGLQRDRFLSAIDLLNANTLVIEVDSGIDYRFRVLEKAEIYHSPLDKAAKASLLDSFTSLATEEGDKGNKIEILGRKIKTVRVADSIVWFSFHEICGGPRSASDYIELALIYQTVLISGVPVLNALNDDQAKRFMIMIDEFYDRNVKVIISAEVEAKNLYSGKRLAKGFKRTISRLQEMGSMEYLKKQHVSE